MKGDTGISCVSWNSRIWLVLRANLKLLRLDVRSAIAVAYQTIFTPFAGRPLDKPHNGRSVRRSRLRVGFASTTAPKSLWMTNPLSITFSGGGGTSSSGSAGDSFKCAPPVTSVAVLHTSVSNPTKISLTVIPSSFASCGPSFSTVTITAHCLVAALSCKGSYTGLFHPTCQSR